MALNLFMSPKKKAFLLQWQKLILEDSPEKLVLSEADLQRMTTQRAQNDLRVLKDSGKLLASTSNPETFFLRLETAEKSARNLMVLEQYITFKGASPSTIAQQFERDRPKLIYDFVSRAYYETDQKARAMKTEKGRAGKYRKFLDGMAPYRGYMDQTTNAFLDKISNSLQ